MTRHWSVLCVFWPVLTPVRVTLFTVEFQLLKRLGNYVGVTVPALGYGVLAMREALLPLLTALTEEPEVWHSLETNYN